MKPALRRIGVLTSGGDAPGMNAAIRAITRSALARGVAVTGIRRGYAGLISADFVDMNSRSVSNTIQRGGTILMSSRCPEMYERSGRRRAADNLRQAGVDGLVTIGGNGSIRGALALWKEEKVRVVHVPSTVDNDLPGTDVTIGFDTAVNTAIGAIDKLRDTAASHGRVFLVEVMGRENGHIAVDAALASGAEAVFVPEAKAEMKLLMKRVQAWWQEGKHSLIIVVAEGDEGGGLAAIANALKALPGIELRTCTLGHIQRGGSPTAHDRVLASTYGAAAVDALLAGKAGVMVSLSAGRLRTVPLTVGLKKPRPSDRHRFALVNRLA
ncbi:MAG: 6-phosphofructokinase [Planctomycetia bacterium]|nr:6-phosphofructokinase [Planctomycetia bacterium]